MALIQLQRHNYRRYRDFAYITCAAYPDVTISVLVFLTSPLHTHMHTTSRARAQLTYPSGSETTAGAYENSTSLRVLCSTSLTPVHVQEMLGVEMWP
jgi:hypothetical protein